MKAYIFYFRLKKARNLKMQFQFSLMPLPAFTNCKCQKKIKGSFSNLLVPLNQNVQKKRCLKYACRVPRGKRRPFVLSYAKLESKIWGTFFRGVNNFLGRAGEKKPVSDLAILIASTRSPLSRGKNCWAWGKIWHLLKESQICLKIWPIPDITNPNLLLILGHVTNHKTMKAEWPTVHKGHTMFFRRNVQNRPFLSRFSSKGPCDLCERQKWDCLCHIKAREATRKGRRLYVCSSGLFPAFFHFWEEKQAAWCTQGCQTLEQE